MNDFGIADLAEGMEFSFTETVSAADLDAFGRLSGDLNPVHLDEAYARSSGFPGRIAHGAFLVALLSRLVGMQVPGRRALIHGFNVKFRRPVPAGTRLVVGGTIDQLSAENRVLVLKVAVREAGGAETFATGTIQVGFTRPEG